MATAVRRSNTDASLDAACPGLLQKPLDATMGNYLLGITPVAARATGKQTTIKKYTYKAGPFNGHVDAPVRNHTHRPMEEVQGFTRSCTGLRCTGLRYWASIMSNNINGTWLRRFFSMFFIVKTEGKGHGLMLRPLFFIGV